ncbi:hypothetical protein ACGFSB_26775 [Streptomyces sp. NPDC048441]|uniref:hypothetical protein n=1 Tax=Streptomyces sp. NPDC048441 TaxID=3365552 RepID=UPI003710E421
MSMSLGGDLGNFGQRDNGLLTPPPGATPGGRVLGVFMLLVTLLVCGIGVAKFAAAAGYIGTRGDLVVAECYMASGGRNHSDTRWCSGTFHAYDNDGADSGPRDEYARVKTRDAQPKDTVEVSHSGGEYVAVGLGSSWGFMVMAFFGLLLAAPALAVAVSGISPRAGRGAAEAIRESVSGTWAGRVVKWTAITSAAGMALFGYLAWLF